MSTLEELKKHVTEGDPDGAKTVTEKLLEEGVDPNKIVKEAIVPGVEEAGELWKKNVYFLPELVMSAEAFREAMTLIEPKMAREARKPLGRVAIGVVEGDVHDLGKTIVIAWLRATGFEVVDLGVDIPIQTFVEKVKELKPDILGIGAYMSTTMVFMKDIIDIIKKEGLRDKVKIMVGGVPITQKYAEDVGADAWGKDAIDAVEKAKTLMGVS